jgi:hypothetical protein
VPLDRFAGALEDQGLCCVQTSEIRRAARFVGPLTRVEEVLRFREQLARFLQKRSALRLHRSMPSARISCINGMRSSL